jgi:cell division septation protein DedD
MFGLLTMTIMRGVWVDGSAFLKTIFAALAALAFCACGSDEARRLPDSGFAVEFVKNDIPSTMTAGNKSFADVVIRNISKQTWPSQPNANNRNQVNLSYRWKDPRGQVLVADGLRTPLPRNLAPGESVRLKMSIETPARPGRYVIEVTLVQEAVAWFDEKGGAVLVLPVVVSAATVKKAESEITPTVASSLARTDDKPVKVKPASVRAQSKKDAAHGLPDKAQEADAAAKSTTGPWFVQVGSFPGHDSAESYAKKLAQKGYFAYVLEADVNGKKYYRVRVGRMASREEAVALQRVLNQKENLPRTIVAK